MQRWNLKEKCKKCRRPKHLVDMDVRFGTFQIQSGGETKERNKYYFRCSFCDEINFLHPKRLPQPVQDIARQLSVAIANGARETKMKATCVSLFSDRNESLCEKGNATRELSLGRNYLIFDLTDNAFRVVNDIGLMLSYPAHMFKFTP